MAVRLSQTADECRDQRGTCPSSTSDQIFLSPEGARERPLCVAAARGRPGTTAALVSLADSAAIEDWNLWPSAVTSSKRVGEEDIIS